MGTSFGGLLPAAAPTLLGLSPQALQAISQGLLGFGGGLLSGRNWGEGLGQGLLGAGQGLSNAQDQWMRQQYYDRLDKEAERSEEKDKRETEAEQRKQEAIDVYILSQPAEKRTALRAAANLGALDNIVAGQFETPELQVYNEGDWVVDPVTGKVVLKVPKTYAPQQPPADPELVRLARSMGLDPKSPEGRAFILDAKGGSKGSGYITATGPGGITFPLNPETGQTGLVSDLGRLLAIEELGGMAQGQPRVPYSPQGEEQFAGLPAEVLDWEKYRKQTGVGQPSAMTEVYERALAYAKAKGFPDPEGWALAYSRSGSPQYELPDPGFSELPKTEDGEIDFESLAVGTIYATPGGMAKWLGDNQWEPVE